MLAVSIRELTKSYGDLRAVDQLDLEIERGETMCLLGPNGAGKSTALKLMLGLIRADSGVIEILGQPAHTISAKRALAYIAQDNDFPLTSTAHEIIEFVCLHYQRPVDVEQLISSFSLQDIAHRQTVGFSGGQRRRLALALAFAGGSEIVLLDEPTTGLDSEARHAFWQFAASYVDDGGTLIVTTHHLHEIESIASRICLMHKGKIRLEGRVRDIRQSIGQKRIRFRCAQAPALSPVIDMTHHNGVVEMVSFDADQVIRQLVGSGVAFSDLDITTISLEQAIRQISDVAGQTP